MTILCIDCHMPLSERTQQKARAGDKISGLCIRCFNAAKSKPPRACGCGARISHMAKAGRCRKCARAAKPPEAEQNRIAAVRRSSAAMLPMKQRVARQNGAAHLSWMPKQYREHYRYLRRTMHCNAAEAQKLIREQMKADSRGLDPFAAALIFAGLAEAA